jgi:hypothetical protein
VVKKAPHSNAKAAPKLPQARSGGNMSEHVPTIAEKRSSCRYCSCLLLKHKHDGVIGERPKKSNLCSLHFDAYHDGNAIPAV